MKYREFIVSVFFICSLLPGVSLAHDKAIVIPLTDEVKCRCTGTLSPGGRWCDHGDGTVLDMPKGTVWLKNATWGGWQPWRNPQGYNDAQTRASSLESGASGSSLSDGSVAGDWRLPTKSELYSLIASPEKVSFGTPRFFTNIGQAPYWSGTSFISDWFINYAYTITITVDRVETGIDLKDGDALVWPLRPCK